LQKALIHEQLSSETTGWEGWVSVWVHEPRILLEWIKVVGEDFWDIAEGGLGGVVCVCGEDFAEFGYLGWGEELRDEGGAIRCVLVSSGFGGTVGSDVRLIDFLDSHGVPSSTIQ